MGLSFAVMALYFHRLAVFSLPNAEVIVSAFLPLGPLGQVHPHCAPVAQGSGSLGAIGGCA